MASASDRLLAPPEVPEVGDQVHGLVVGELHHARLDVGVTGHVQPVEAQVRVVHEHALPASGARTEVLVARYAIVGRHMAGRESLVHGQAVLGAQQPIARHSARPTLTTIGVSRPCKLV